MEFKSLKNKGVINLSSSKFICKIFIGSIIKKGNKIRSFNNFFYVMILLSRVYDINDPLNFIISAIDKVRPRITFVSKKVAGIVYKLPRFMSIYKSRAVSIRWIISSASTRNSYEHFTQKLAGEFIDINRGIVTSAVKKRNDAHNLAKSNRPFLRYLKKRKK
jgi:small subunit ribosomal protein S7